MLMDIIMESLSSMDEETLNGVLESMSEEEMDVINGYLDELDTEEDDADTSGEDMEDVIEAFMSLNDDELDQVIESLTTEEFEYLKEACEKAIDFDKKVYDTRKNPAKFTITPNTLTEAGISKERADELFDALCDYMAKKKYIVWGENESPEKIAEHFKEERRIMASDITEFGWRYFKKAKIIMLKNKGGKSQLQELLDKANNKAITSAKWENVGVTALKLIAWTAAANAAMMVSAIAHNSIVDKAFFGKPTAGNIEDYIDKQLKTADNVILAGKGAGTGIFIGGAIKSAKDYSENRRKINEIASRA